MRPSRDVDGIRRLGPVRLGQLGGQQAGATEHRVRVRPGPAAREEVGPGIDPAPRARARSGSRSSSVISSSRIGRPVQSRYRCRNEARRFPGAGRSGCRRRPEPGPARHTRPRTCRAAFARPPACPGPASPVITSCWPSRAVPSPVAATLRMPPVPDRSRPRSTRCATGGRVPTPPRCCGGSLGIGLAGYPGVAECRKVDDGVDPLLGELCPEAVRWAEVGRGFGQEHGRAAGKAERVEDQITRPAGAVVSPWSTPSHIRPPDASAPASPQRSRSLVDPPGLGQLLEQREA